MAGEVLFRELLVSDGMVDGDLDLRGLNFFWLLRNVSELDLFVSLPLHGRSVANIARCRNLVLISDQYTETIPIELTVGRFTVGITVSVYGKIPNRI